MLAVTSWVGREGLLGCPETCLQQAFPPPRASQPCARAPTGLWVDSMAASMKCASTTSSRTSRLSHHSRWGSLQAASPAPCASMACATQWRRTAWYVSATRAGLAHCVTRKPGTPASATGQCPARPRLPMYMLSLPLPEEGALMETEALGSH